MKTFLFILSMICTINAHAHVTRGAGDTYHVDSHGAEFDNSDLGKKSDFIRSTYEINGFRTQ